MIFSNSQNSSQKLRRKLPQSAAFTLLELIMVLGILGVILTIAIPNYSAYLKAACVRKLQLQVIDFRLALKAQLRTNPDKIDLQALYNHLEFPDYIGERTCGFSKQPNGFIIHDNGRVAYFRLKDKFLECQHTKSDKLESGENFCDLF